MDAPEGTRLSEYREKKTIERLEQARLERKLERKRKKEAELRRKKPHLFNVASETSEGTLCVLPDGKRHIRES